MHVQLQATGDAQRVTQAPPADDDELRHAVRSMEVDQFLVEAILDSYLEEISRAGDMIRCDAIMTAIEVEPSFRGRAHRAVADGLVLSSYATTLDDGAFKVALEELSPLGDPELDRMREKIFEQGLQVACASGGGSPARGKSKTRSELFLERALELRNT